MTNLLKEDGHKKSEIENYLLRWGKGLDFRNLKETLDAGKLRAKSSEMVEKELWVNLIAYNMIRKINSMISLKSKKKVREQSFKAGKELLEILTTGRGEKIFEELLELFKGEFLKTKFRREPRLIRFAGKKYDVLKTTRNKVRIMLR